MSQGKGTDEKVPISNRLCAVLICCTYCQTPRPTRKQPQTAGPVVCPVSDSATCFGPTCTQCLHPVPRTLPPQLLIITPQTLLLVISVNVFLLNILYFTFKLTKAHSLHQSLWTCCPTTVPALTAPPDLPMPSILYLDAETFLSYIVKGKPFSSTHLEQL